MGIFRKLRKWVTGHQEKPLNPKKEPVPAQNNSDIISGYQFIATMSKNTPLSVLERHGEIHNDLSSTPPAFCAQKDGIWIPKLKTWSELTNGRITKEFCPTMSSDIGQIPCDGGDYLSFLKDFRRIVEQEISIKERIYQLKALTKKNSHYKKFAESHFAEKWFGIHISCVPGIGKNAITSLESAGIITINSLGLKTDDEILKINNIGPSTLKKMKDYYELMKDSL